MTEQAQQGFSFREDNQSEWVGKTYRMANGKEVTLVAWEPEKENDPEPIKTNLENPNNNANAWYLGTDGKVYGKTRRVAELFDKELGVDDIVELIG